MRIQTPSTLNPAEIAWEGQLESPPDVTFAPKGPPPRVSIGKLVWWSAADALESETGKKWTPPSGDRRYTLVRMSFTLHPPNNGRIHFDDATLATTLKPGSGRGHTIAHDLLPDRVSVPITRKYTAGLTPELKFTDAFALKAGELGAEISFEQALPVVQSYGRGQSNPTWQFKDHTARPLQGDLFVYMVMAAPAVSDSTWVTLSLMATLSTRYGPARFVLPAAATDSISQSIR